MLDLIEFHNQDIEFELPNAALLQQWIYNTILAENNTLSVLNYIFCSDEYLYQLNMEYLQHDTYTDVITFPYSDEVVEGDIFISLERTRDNAHQYGVSAEHELHRVIIHGVLHLLGYFDESPEEEAEMRQKEDFYLAQLAILLKNNQI